ncbi:MAG: hypothetical protein WCV62_00705 [Candidatus Peribacteraceae bacterium]|jgi:hypothetical protein
MNTHNTFPAASFSLSEARLCYQNQSSPSQLPDAMRAEQEMVKNPDVMQAKEAYEAFLRIKRPELLDQPDRTYFLAMVTNEMLLPAWEQRDQQALWPEKGRIDYGSYRRENIRAADPFDLLNRQNMQEEVEKLTAEAEAAKQRSELLTRQKDEAEQRQESQQDIMRMRQAAEAAQRAAIVADEALAQAKDRMNQADADRDAVAGAQEKWVMEGVLDNTLMEKTADQYLAWRAQLDAVLGEKGIRVPRKQSQDTPWAKDDLLREEYFRLLVLVSQGKAEDVQKSAQGGLEGLRALLTGEAGRLGRASRVYEELVPQELGSTETLNMYGFVPGPAVRNAYWKLRSGTDGAWVKPGEAPQAADAAAPVLRPGESAAAWLDNPMLAWEFLKDPATGFISKPENKKFLDALQYWNDPESRGDRQTEPEISEEATKAILNLIVLSLLEYERMLGNSARQRTEIKLRENIGEKIEGQARGVWEYIKEYRDHPLGSALVAGAAFVALRAIYKFLFKNEHNNFVKWAVRGGLLGLAIGLYQKNTTGKAWWEGAWNKVEQWRGKERALKPEDQMLPRYWSAECKITDPQKRDCMLLIEEQDSKQTLDWYGRMDQALLAGKVRNNASLPADLQLPFRLDSTTKERVFGQKSNTEIALLFYTTLKEFFKNRGEAVKKEGGPLADREKLTDPATLGYHYIYEKYITRRIVTSIAGSLRYKNEIEPITEVRENLTSGTRRTTTLVPGSVTENRMEEYTAQEQEQDMAHWPMWNIFLLEADPATLRKMGREAATPATMLEQLKYRAVEAAGYGRILIANTINATDALIQKLIDKVGPALKDLPGTIVRVTGQAGKYVVEVLNSAGAAIGTFTVDTYTDAVKEIYALHGVPKEKYEQYVLNVQHIEGLEYNGTNAGLRASILGTKEVVIGQFTPLDYVPGDTYLRGNKTSITVPASEFASANAAKLDEWVENWRQTAIVKKSSELLPLAVPSYPDFTISLPAGQEWVEYGRPGGAGGSGSVGRSSIYEFIQLRSNEILQKYKAWVSNVGRPATSTDPLHP